MPFTIMRSVGLVSLAILLVCAALAPSISAADAGCGKPVKDEGGSHGVENIHYLVAESLDLTCYPAVIHAPEGVWTFLLRGSDAIWIDKAVLIDGSNKYNANKITYPTTSAALINFTYSPMQVGTNVELVLTWKGKEVYRFSLLVTEGHKVSPAARQPDLVRVQLEPWTLQYPLHGFRGERNQVPDREVSELEGEPDFLSCLADLDVPRLRKVMSRYAEDDSMHWDKRFERYNHYRSKQLRQYIMYLNPGCSEAAYKEIFLGFPGVEKAFVNEDKSKRRKKK